MSSVKIAVEDHTLEFEVDGKTTVGKDEVLLSKDDNLIADAPWADTGYTVESFLPPTLYQTLHSGITEIFRDLLQRHGCKLDADFKLEHYHRYVTTDSKHAEIIKEAMCGFEPEQFPLSMELVEKRISAICQCPVTIDSKNEIAKSLFFVRVARPLKSSDHNPPHRDVWLDHLRNAVNIYVPIAGSNEKSSLPIVPKSHLFKESEIERTAEGAKINGVRYHVASVTALTKTKKMVRPNPRYDQVLVFSPYLIHGGAVNLNEELTRFSLEMRFWRRS